MMDVAIAASDRTGTAPVTTTSWLSSVPNIGGPGVDRYDVHQTLWRAFPDNDPKSPAPFLYRVDVPTASILVRSTVEPRWPFQGVRSKVERHIWHGGDHVTIDVHLCPVRRTRHGEKSIVEPPDLVAYGLRMSAALGASPLEHPEDDDQPSIYVSPLWTGEASEVPMNGRAFMIVAQVDDAMTFNHTMIRGLGRKKFLGFGMPLVVPAGVIR